MNAPRRAALNALISKIEEIKSEAETLASEERDYYDNMPESLQQGEKGEAASAAADALESVEGSLQEAIDQISEAIGG